MMTDSRMHDLTIGYDLDASGDAFEPAPDALGDGCAMVDSDRAIRDAFPWAVDSANRDRTWNRRGTLAYVHSVHSRDTWPTFVDGDLTWTPAAHGPVNGTDRTCWECEGTGHYPPDDSDPEVGDPEPLPCERCDGCGTVDSPGGSWALYLLTDEAEIKRRAEDEAREQAEWDAAHAEPDHVRPPWNGLGRKPSEY